MRSDELRRTGQLHSYTDADRSLIAHMALLGRFHLVPEPLFFQRIHTDMSSAKFDNWRDRMRWWGPAASHRVPMPYWFQLGHYLRMIASSPVGVRTKLRCTASMATWVVRHRHWMSLAKDLLIGASVLWRRALERLRPRRR